MNDEVMISLENVSKTFSGRKILDEVTLEVRRGETLVIIGRSGAGKSVTLKHIMGLMHPDSGRVKVIGTDITHFKPRQYYQIRNHIGVLFQGAALLNWMTVGENVALPLKEHTRMKPPEILAKVREKLMIVELSDAEHKYPSKISGGMAKRAGLARAIIRNPEIILYDEPTSGLDPVMSNTINDLINKIKEELQTASIVVTHDMSSAYRIADRIAMLYQGKIIQQGTPDEIRNTKNEYVRQFIEGRTQGPLTDPIS
ncbi:MAG: ABC transporter ATP-binding protein [Planctomycetota bacterium]